MTSHRSTPLLPTQVTPLVNQARSLLQPQRRTQLHRLRRHQFLSLQGRGLCLRAERGTLWVTVNGDPADIELGAGESRVFSELATVVVGTLGGDAVLSVSTPAGPAWAPSLAGQLANRLNHWWRSSVQGVHA